MRAILFDGERTDDEQASQVAVALLGDRAEPLLAADWARELRKLGHDVRLMPPSYVKAYVKRGKNDAAGAQSTMLMQ